MTDIGRHLDLLSRLQLHEYQLDLMTECQNTDTCVASSNSDIPTQNGSGYVVMETSGEDDGGNDDVDVSLGGMNCEKSHTSPLLTEGGYHSDGQRAERKIVGLLAHQVKEVLPEAVMQTVRLPASLPPEATLFHTQSLSLLDKGKKLDVIDIFHRNKK